MTDQVASHYSGAGNLAAAIADSLMRTGKDLTVLKTSDLATVDEFHIRGRKATLELADHLQLKKGAHVLDIGSGLGGPARTIAQEYRCHVVGIDLTQEFCDAAEVLSGWVKLDDFVTFRQGNATDLPFSNDQFDAAMTIHVAMNIVEKNRIYEQAKRVLKSGGRFAVYDVLQGEGGGVLFPVPWARDPSISYLATPSEMKALLADADLKVLEMRDSTEESQSWFEAMAQRMTKKGPPPVTFQTFLGGDFPEMARNQVRNLKERRIRTVSFICEA